MGFLTDGFLSIFPTRGVTPSSFCPGLLIFCPFRAIKNYAAFVWLSPVWGNGKGALPSYSPTGFIIFSY